MGLKTDRCNGAGMIATLVLVLACSGQNDHLGPGGSRSKIVLVTFDTLNIDYVGPHNPEIDFTPNLDAFASSCCPEGNRTKSMFS
jgi:hypothetical protein